MEFEDIYPLFELRFFKYLYFVGGFVRDYEEAKNVDIDLVFNAPLYWTELIEFIKSKHRIISYSNFYKTISFTCNTISTTHQIQVNLCRSEDFEKNVYDDLKLDFCEDLKMDYMRRDFTVNALYRSFEGYYIDFSTCEYDIKHKQLTEISHILCDPVRALRAIYLILKGFKYGNIDAILFSQQLYSEIENLQSNVFFQKRVKNELNKIQNIISSFSNTALVEKLNVVINVFKQNSVNL